MFTWAKNIIFYAFVFCSLLCPVFLSRRIGDVSLSYLPVLSLNLQMGQADG